MATGWVTNSKKGYKYYFDPSTGVMARKFLMVLELVTVVVLGLVSRTPLLPNVYFLPSIVFVAYARAAYRMNQEGQKGCKTVFDVAPAYLSALDGAELRKKFL